MTATLLTGPDQKEGLSLAYVRALAARADYRPRCRSPTGTALICESWRMVRVVRPLTCS